MKKGVRIHYKNNQNICAHELMLQSEDKAIWRAYKRALNKQIIWGIMWLIWLQKNHKVISRGLPNLSKYPPSAQFNIMKCLLYEL